MQDVYTHDLRKLVKSAELTQELEKETQNDTHFAVNWGMAKDWSEKSRYQTYDKKQAEELLGAITDSDHGVLKWISRFW